MRKGLSSMLILSMLIFSSPLPFSANVAHAAVVTVVRGVVLYSNGSPVPSHWVSFHLSDGTFSTETMTNSDGEFVFNIDAAEISIGKTYVLELNAPSGYNKPTNSPVNQMWDGTQWQDVTFQFIPASKTVTGKVAYKDSGQPVRSAEIRAFPVKGFGVGSVSAIVNEKGEYSMNLRSGTNWYVNATNNLSNQNDDWMMTTPPVLVTFQNDEEPESKTLNFEAEHATGNVKVKLLNSDGRGITTSDFIGDVSWSRSDGIGTVRKLTGQSTLSVNLVPGIYSFYAYHQDLNGKSFPEESLNVVVQEGESVDLGTIQAEVNTGEISGTLVDSSGKPFSGVQVMAQHTQIPFQAVSDTNQKGQFSLTVGQGIYRLTLGQGLNNTIRMAEPVEIMIPKNGDRVEGIELPIEKWNATLEGSILDSNDQILAGVSGTVTLEVGDQFFSGPVEDGKYTIQFPENLGGKNSLLGFQGDGDGGDNGYSLSQRRELALKQHQSEDIVLRTDNAVLTGLVKDENGKTLKSEQGAIELIATDEMGNTETGVVNEDGSYELSVPNGEWSIGYKVNGDHPDFMNVATHHERVLVRANKTTAENITVLEREGTLTGTISDDDGNAVPLAPVRISNLPNLFESGKDFDASDVIELVEYADNEGKINVKLPSGDFTGIVGSTPSVSSMVEPESKEFTIRDGKTISQDFSFRSPDATVKGSVKDENGKPVQYGKIAAFTQDGAFVDSEINENGSYSIPLKAGEDWTIVASAFDGSDVLMTKTEIKPTDGETTQDLRLADSGIDAGGAVSMKFSGDASASLSLPDGTSVSLPPFAIDSTGGAVSVNISPTIDLSPTASGESASIGYSIQAFDSNGYEVTKLNREAKITVQYDESYLDQQGISEDTIIPEFYREQEELWGIDGVTSFVNQEKNEAVFFSDHLSKFSLQSVKTGKSVKPLGLSVTKADGLSGVVHVFNSAGTSSASIKTFSGKVLVKTDQGDIDGDGDQEIIAGQIQKGASSLVRLFSGKGKKIDEWTVFSKTIKGGVEALMVDVDGDGDKEIAFAPYADSNLEIVVYDWDGSKKSMEKLTQVSVFAPLSKTGLRLFSADVHGDGKEEIIAIPIKQTSALVLSYDESKGLEEFFSFQLPSSEMSVAFSDVNGNESEEMLMIPSGGNKVSSLTIKEFQSKTSSFKTIKEMNVFGSKIKGSFSVQSGDLDSNGLNDIIVASANKGEIHLATLEFKGKKLLTKDHDMIKGFSKGASMIVSRIDRLSGHAIILAGAMNGLISIYDLDANGKHEKKKDFFPFGGKYKKGLLVY